MVKITSIKWAEKDDPMFTGRFKMHLVRKYAHIINKEKSCSKKGINYVWMG